MSITTSTRKMTAKEQMAFELGYEKALRMLAWRIDCNTLISELEGWKSIVEMSVYEARKWIWDDNLK